MHNMWYKLKKWLDLNVVWFFVHPSRHAALKKHLKKKYGNKTK